MVETRQKRKKLAEEAIAAKKEAEAKAFDRLVLKEEWRDWCSPIIDDLLPSIVSFLVTLADFSSFGAVCRKWRSISSDVSPLTMSSQSPLLLSRRRRIRSKYFIDAIHHRIYKSPLLSLDNHRILGYTHGHLVAKPHNHYMPILLVNIFTGTETKLPLMPNSNFIRERILLSSSPSSPGCIAILLVFESFHYCCLGDPHWTRYELPLPYSVVDVIFVGNRLYALTKDDRLCFFSFAPRPIFTMLEAKFATAEAPSRWRLAESAGDLLAIRCQTPSYNYHFDLHDIWRWDGCGFVKVSSLGESALFFGNGRFAGSLTTYVGSRVTGNSIYHTWGGEYSVYSLGTKTIIDKVTYLPAYESVWILPNLC